MATNQEIFERMTARLRNNVPAPAPSTQPSSQATATFTFTAPRTNPIRFSTSALPFNPLGNAPKAVANGYLAESSSSVLSDKLITNEENSAPSPTFSRPIIKGDERSLLDYDDDDDDDDDDDETPDVPKQPPSAAGPSLYGTPESLAEIRKMNAAMSKSKAARGRSVQAHHAITSHHSSAPTAVNTRTSFSPQLSVTSSASGRSDSRRQAPQEGNLWGSFDRRIEQPRASSTGSNSAPALASLSRVSSAAATIKIEHQDTMGGPNGAKSGAQSKEPANLLPPHLRVGKTQISATPSPKTDTPAASQGLNASKYAVQTFPPKHASGNTTPIDGQTIIKTEPPTLSKEAAVISKVEGKAGKKPLGLAIDPTKANDKDDFSFPSAKKTEPASGTAAIATDSASAGEMQKLRERIEKLEEINDRLEKAVIVLQEEAERRNFLGTEEAMRPFKLMVKYGDHDLRLQVHKQLTIADLIRRILFHTNANARSTKNPCVAFQGRKVGHGMTLGELAIVDDCTVSFSCDEKTA